MLPTDFTDSSTGQLVRHPTGYWTFLPAPAPRHQAIDHDLSLLLSRADAAVGELSGVGRHLPNPELLISPYSRREAVLSSRIEGTQASLSDVLLDELDPKRGGGETNDVREVRNYVRALRVGTGRLSKIPLSLRLVREVHAELMEGVRGQDKTPGEFRRSQNWIGPPGSTPMTAPFLPPPPEELANALADWERFVNTRELMPDLIQCALMHEQFETIHPFLDGNGRIGRLLITLFLIERGRLDKPLLYLSAFIEAHRQDYYDLLQRVRTHGDRPAWIRFFLTGVTETARQAIAQADALLRLREEVHAKLAGKHRARALVDALFVNPYITVARAAEALKVSQPTAGKSIDLLKQLGVLREVTGKSWGRIFLAEPILDAIENPPPP